MIPQTRDLLYTVTSRRDGLVNWIKYRAHIGTVFRVGKHVSSSLSDSEEESNSIMAATIKDCNLMCSANIRSSYSKTRAAEAEMYQKCP